MDISRVQLQGLQAAQHLNGAIGVVVGDPDAETGRIPVKLLGELGKSMPHGIKVKPSNISHLPRQTGVQLKGTQAQEVSLTQQQSRTLSSGSWISCQVPTLLGIPMAMKQLAPTTQATRLQWECAAVYMLVDPNSGFAPGWVQMNGRGEVLLARTDGQDLSAGLMWQLHDYNCNLMDRWGEWMEEGLDTPEVRAERAAALSPAGFQAFIKDRAEGEGSAPEDDSGEDVD